MNKLISMLVNAAGLMAIIILTVVATFIVLSAIFVPAIIVILMFFNL